MTSHHITYLYPTFCLTTDIFFTYRLNKFSDSHLPLVPLFSQAHFLSKFVRTAEYAAENKAKKVLYRRYNTFFGNLLIVVVDNIPNLLRPSNPFIYIFIFIFIFIFIVIFIFNLIFILIYIFIFAALSALNPRQSLCIYLVQRSI